MCPMKQDLVQLLKEMTDPSASSRFPSSGRRVNKTATVSAHYLAYPSAQNKTRDRSSFLQFPKSEKTSDFCKIQR